MGDTVKEALPIVGTAVGSAFGSPEAGFAVGSEMSGNTGPVASGDIYGSMLGNDGSGGGLFGGLGSALGISKGDLASGLMTGGQLWGAANQASAIKAQQNATKAQLERASDTANRHEATYRQDRQMLMGALAHFYEQAGWKMPDPSVGALPGAGTARQLPFESPLYTGEKQFAGGPQNANAQPGQPQYVTQDGKIVSDPTINNTIVRPPADQGDMPMMSQSTANQAASGDQRVPNPQTEAAANLFPNMKWSFQ